MDMTPIAQDEHDGEQYELPCKTSVFLSCRLASVTLGCNACDGRPLETQNSPSSISSGYLVQLRGALENYRNRNTN